MAALTAAGILDLDQGFTCGFFCACRRLVETMLRNKDFSIQLTGEGDNDEKADHTHFDVRGVPGGYHDAGAPPEAVLVGCKNFIRLDSLKWVGDRRSTS